MAVSPPPDVEEQTPDAGAVTPAPPVTPPPTTGISPPPDVDAPQPASGGPWGRGAGVVEGLGEAVSNIPGDAVRLLGEIGQVLGHPIQTGKAVGGLVGEMAGVARGTTTPAESPRLTALAEMMTDNYGSLEAAGKTFRERPLQVLEDMSVAFGIGGVAIPGKVGKTLGTVARATDPVVAGVQGGSLVLRAPAKLGRKWSVEGGLGASTGTGPETIRVALDRNTKAFREAFRGDVSFESIVTEIKDGLRRLRQARGSEYRSQLAKLKSSTAQIDSAPIKKRLDDLLDDYAVESRIDPDIPPSPELTAGQPGGPRLDFSRSAIGSQGQRDIIEAAELVNGWDDWSVVGVDHLKRRLDDISVPLNTTKQARAFVAALRGEVTDALYKVPGYKKMTAGYATATEMIETVDRTLAAGKSPEQAITKLANALNQRTDYRMTVIEMFDAAAGTNVLEHVAGASLRPVLPSGIMRPMVASMFTWGAIGTGNFTALPALLLASPRAVGELLTAYALVRQGKVGVAAGTAASKYPGALVYRPAAVAGEIDEGE